MFNDINLELSTADSEGRTIKYGRYIVAAVLIGLVGSLIYIILNSASAVSPIPALIVDNIGATGVINPVTAVLLDFRSYDTLLEIAVIYIVFLAMASSSRYSYEPITIGSDFSYYIQSFFTRMMAPLIIVVGGYILWTGAYNPGGAFQAGALLAGLGLLLFLNTSKPIIINHTLVTGLVTCGLWLFIGIGLLIMLLGNNFLNYPNQHAGILILAIEVAATLSIASILLAFILTLAKKLINTMPKKEAETIKQGQIP